MQIRLINTVRQQRGDGCISLIHLQYIMPGSRHCQKLRQSAASGTAAVELASKQSGQEIFVLFRHLDKIQAI